MIKILFLIHDLGQGGAEKVLVNLVNNMDRTKFDISVTALFGGGVNEQFLKPDIHYRTVFSRMIPGNTKFMKLFTPEQLHKFCVKEQYDIEVSYLEGPSARVISGCRDKNTKLISWIHSKQDTLEELAYSFRNVDEAKDCYERFDYTVFVAEGIKKAFCECIDFQGKCGILYNTVESDKILEKAQEIPVNWERIKDNALVTVGTLKEVKGYERLLRIIKRLKDENYKLCLYILGIGPLKDKLENYISENELEEYVKLLGYQINPYQYVSRCDLYVCSSFSEGFSTAVTEALILGVPVCTTDVSGMREMLGENSEYGIITANDEEALYCYIKKLLDSKELLTHYKEQAKIRGNHFNMQETLNCVENLFMDIRS